MDLKLDEAKTSYHGKRERIVVIRFCGEQRVLGLRETRLAAADEHEALMILRSMSSAVAPQADLGFARQLRDHCRVVTKWKESVKVDRKRQRFAPVVV